MSEHESKNSGGLHEVTFGFAVPFAFTQQAEIVFNQLGFRTIGPVRTV